MFCPSCGFQATAETKFCKQCGANLRGVRDAMQARGEQFDWSKTWVAEMFLTEEERERRRGVTPEKKRNDEIRAGVITSSVGVGVMIFLYFLLQPVAAQNNANDAEIIRRVWLAGLIPFLVGVAIILNGLFIGRREVQRHKQQAQPPLLPTPQPMEHSSQGKTTGQLAAPAAATALPEFSVTEQTTAHLPEKMADKVAVQVPEQVAVPLHRKIDQ